MFFLRPLLCVGIFLLPSFASAAIDVVEQQKMDCGKLEAPPPGSNRNIQFDYNGTIVSGNATVFEPPTFGQFLVTDTSSKTLSVNIKKQGNISGLNLPNSRFTASWNGSPLTLPATGITNPGGAGAVLRVGARCVMQDESLDGTYAPPFKIIIKRENN